MREARLMQFASTIPDLTWFIVEADGSMGSYEGTMHSGGLRATLAATPEQVRSPWEATVYVTTTDNGFPVNWLASMMLRQSLAPGDQVHGPMVVFGPVDDDGNVTSVTDDLVAAIRDTASAHRSQS